MAKYTNEQLMQMYKKLPKDLQSAILSVDTANIIQDIGKKYKLMVDKIGELADETGLVMLGLSSPSQFIPNLASRLNIDKETARNVAADINSQIFAKVRDSLKKVHGIGGEETVPQPAFSQPKSEPVFRTSQPAPATQPASPQSNLPPSPPSTLPIKEERDIHPAKAEILKELEKEKDQKIPDILKGTNESLPSQDPFSAKTNDGIFRMPTEQKRYDGTDPYREPVI